jgi:GT2 family glycosyltransferase
VSSPTILIVIPTYGQFDYATRAVRTALENTKLFYPYVVVIDDASPERLAKKIHHPDEPYGQYLAQLKQIREEFGSGSVVQMEFDQNGGLTRSWNVGLQAARGTGLDFCCVTNSDVVFPRGWDTDIFDALQFKGYALAGPLTNAPGSNPDQYVGRYSLLYRRETAEADYQDVQDELWCEQRGRWKETTLNGFCMIAKTQTWWDNAYDKDHVFRPRNDVNSKGEPNPTPLMTLNEYELQRRWKEKGLRAVACLGSYVFHYRAVSRGDRHKQGDWVRAGVQA